MVKVWNHLKTSEMSGDIRNNTKLPKRIYEIIIGLILGDGCLSKNSTSVKFIRLYSTNSSNPLIPAKIYPNADLQKQDIIKENQSKSSIYRWVNIINGRSYVGSAVNLSKRISEHYLGFRSNIILQQALKKYGLVNFSIQILEFCDKSALL